MLTVGWAVCSSIHVDAEAFSEQSVTYEATNRLVLLDWLPAAGLPTCQVVYCARWRGVVYCDFTTGPVDDA